LTVSANEAKLAGNISTDGGASADIDFRGTKLVTLTGDVILDTAAPATAVGGDILFGPASNIVGAHSLTLNCQGTGTNGNIQINDADVSQFTISAASVGTATLYGTILSTNTIDLSGATTITLADTASLETTGGAQNITIGTATINGAHPLTVTATGAVNFDVINDLTGLTVNAASVDFAGAVSMPGDISVTASAVSATAIDVESAASIGSTSGSVTFTATGGGISGITLNNNVSADQSVTLSGPVTLATNPIVIIATNGDINLNAAVNATAGEGLTLTAGSTVYAQAIGTGALGSVGALAITADAAELDGDIKATSVDTHLVGLTTLTNPVTITTTGAINLGALDGANDLILDAGATGDVTLRNATIASLGVTCKTVLFSTGTTFTTTGDVTVTAAATSITSPPSNFDTVLLNKPIVPKVSSSTLIGTSTVSS